MWLLHQNYQCCDQLDKERDHYNLREANLVRVLVKACLLDPKTSSAAKKAENWRQAGVKNAGQFSNVMEEVPAGHCSGLADLQPRLSRRGGKHVSKLVCMCASSTSSGPAVGSREACQERPS